MRVACLFLVGSVFLQGFCIKAVRISGGISANTTDFPFQARLVKAGQLVCNAVIIRKKWLLTAGNCLHGQNISSLKVKTGAIGKSNQGQVHNIKKVIVHPGYKQHNITATNDIGLIELAKPIKLNDQQNLIKIKPNHAALGDSITVSGFVKKAKYLAFKRLSLKATNLTTVTLDYCQSSYTSDPITDKMVCAVGKRRNGTCFKATGGPGIIGGLLSGIIASGIDCKNAKIPIVFTAVDKYTKWINKNIGT